MKICCHLRDFFFSLLLMGGGVRWGVVYKFLNLLSFLNENLSVMSVKKENVVQYHVIFSVHYVILSKIH